MGKLRVVLGARVEIEMVDEAGQNERMTFDIVPDNAADTANGFLGVSTPLAQALMHQLAGTSVSYRMADIVEVRILSVTASERVAAQDAAERRQTAAQEAISRSNLDEATRLALTFNSKWGDYDPEGLEDHWE